MHNLYVSHKAQQVITHWDC